MFTSLGLMAMPVSALFMAATTDGGGSLNDPFTYLTGLGFPGIIIALLLTGQLVPKGVIDRMSKDLDRKDEIIKAKDEQIAALQAGLVDKAIPALTRSTQVLERLPSSVKHSENAVLERLDQVSGLQSDMADLARKLESLVRESGST